MKCSGRSGAITLLCLALGINALDAVGQVQEAASSVPVAREASPELKRQLRALFEPLRKTVKSSIKAEAAVLKVLEGDDLQAMERANAKLKLASDELAVKKSDVIGKAEKAGATPDQIQAEWSLWLKEVEQDKKK